MARTKVQSELIATNAISGTIIADGAITSTHLAANCVDSSELVTGSIDTIHIAANQVTATKIVTNGVLTRHISDDQVTADKLANSINTDIATGVTGNTTANAALPKAGGTMTGTLKTPNLTINDGVQEFDKPNVKGFRFLHNDAGNDLSIQQGDTNNANYVTKFNISSAGNVGIGTTSPDDMLDVENGNIRLRSNSDGNTGLLRMFDAAGTESGQIYTASGDLKIYSPNDVLFAQTGNVGIGTNSPNAPLEVSGGVSMSGGWGRSLLLRHAFPVMVFQSEYSTDAYGAIGYDNSTGMHFMVNSPSIDPFSSSQTSALYIRDDKRIGVGTTSVDGGKLVISGEGGSSSATLNLATATSTTFNHAINAFNSNLTNGENNLIVIGRAGSTRNSAWMGYKWYSDASYSNCLTFGHWGNNNIVNLSGYGILMAGGLETAPNYPGAITTARTGSSSTTTQATWGFNATAGGSNKDFGYKAAGAGSYAYGVLNAAETAWMSRLDFSGAIHLTNTTVQSISDRRLKKDIVDANSQWDDIKALQFKNFKWIDEAKGTDTYLGLIADEVESVSPGLVGTDAVSAETMPEDGIDPEYKNVKYSILWMKAVKALQEAMTKIETLETKVKALEEG